MRKIIIHFNHILLDTEKTDALFNTCFSWYELNGSSQRLKNIQCIGVLATNHSESGWKEDICKIHLEHTTHIIFHCNCKHPHLSHE